MKVKCIVKTSPNLTYNKEYTVLKSFPLQFKILTDKGKEKWYSVRSPMFKKVNEHVDIPELDQVQNIADQFLKDCEIKEYTLTQKDGNTVLILGFMTDFYKRLKGELK